MLCWVEKGRHKGMENFFDFIEDGDAYEHKKEALTNKYRHIFTKSEMGAEVLADILVNLCHLGCILETADQVAQYNSGVGILSRLGIFSKANQLEVRTKMIPIVPRH